MANQEQLDILKQGAKEWNAWRHGNPDIKIDLMGAMLNRFNLIGVDLGEADLNETDLRGANLSEANLSKAELIEANLFGVNLSGSALTSTNLLEADLSEANLRGADLLGANLLGVRLNGADLSGADLSEANFMRVDFNGSKFTKVVIQGTLFALTDLSSVVDIGKAIHEGPSTIGHQTLAASKGRIPEEFLRGCGLSDWEIESAKLYNPDLANEEIIKIQYRIFDLRATQAFQISPIFISYSHADNLFVDTLDSALTANGVRFWRDIHDAKAGRLETQIDRAIRQNPTVLLILSRNSLNSDWVQHEVRKARELEKELGRDALCPVALDNTWQSSNWPQRLMEQVMEYNILDFSGWENDSTFNAKFAKLLSGLDLFYKKPLA